MPDQYTWVPWTQFSPERLRQNVEALRLYHPALWESIQPWLLSNSLCLRPGINGYVECGMREQERTRLLLGVASLEVELPRVSCSLQALSPPSESSLIFVLGFDLGYSFQLLLPHLTQADKKAALVIEPDIRFFAASLAVQPLESIFCSNRILWAVGDAWEEQLEAVFDRQHLFAAVQAEVVLSVSGSDSRRKETWKQVQAVSQNLARAGRQKFDQELATAQLYYRQKPAESIRKVMAPYYKQGKAIPYIQKRFLDQCEAQGIQVAYHHPALLRGVALLRDIIREKPDLLLCINKSPSELAPIHFLNSLRLPRMIWCIDDPNVFIKDDFGEHDFVFTWDLSYTQDQLNKKALAVDHFPYVADLDRVEAVYEERFRANVSYIGQVNPFSAESLGIDEKYIPLIQQVASCKALDSRRRYQSLIREYQNHYGFTLITSENDEIPRFIRYGIYVMANARRRISILEKALPFGLKLYGNEGWLEVLGDHPLRACYQGPADPERDVPRIFVSSLINLNIHSLQARSSLNQRDFNCPCVGGFLLTDWVEHADWFFVPQEEMVFYSGPEDLPEKIEYYLTHPEERQRIAQKGKERVLREHTYATRVPHVLETLQDRIRERYGETKYGD